MDYTAIADEHKTVLNYFAKTVISKITDGEQIANAIVKLSAWNALLGQFVADLEREMDNYELALEVESEEKYLDARENKGFIDSAGKEKAYSADDAKAFKKINTADERQEYLNKKHAYRSASILRVDTSNLVDALRSKLSHMRQERAQTPSQNDTPEGWSQA